MAKEIKRRLTEFSHQEAKLPVKVQILRLADYKARADPGVHTFDIDEIRARAPTSTEEYGENMRDAKQNPYKPARFDFARLLQDLAAHPAHDKTTDYYEVAPLKTVQFRGCRVVPPTVLIVEGLYALYDEEIRALAAMCIFVDLDGDTRLGRWILRDSRDDKAVFIAICNEYINWCRPEMERYVYGTKDFADVILPHGNETESVKLVTNGIYDRVYRDFVGYLQEKAPADMAPESYLSPVVSSLLRNEGVPVLSLAEEAAGQGQYYDVN